MLILSICPQGLHIISVPSKFSNPFVYLNEPASWVDYILITNFNALIIIYSWNTILLYMFWASSAHLQEDIVVYMLDQICSVIMAHNKLQEVRLLPC